MPEFIESLIAEADSVLDGEQTVHAVDAEIDFNSRAVEIVIEKIEKRHLTALYSHLQKTMEVCDLFARTTQMDPRMKILFGIIGGAHDVGKMSFSGLVEKYPLTLAETQLYCNHVEQSVRLLQDLRGKTGRKIRQITGDHHERPQGNGYPEGKRGDKISAMTVMFIVLDVLATIVWPDENAPRAKMHPLERLKLWVSELRKGASDGEFGRGATELLFDAFKKGAFDNMKVEFQGQTFRIGDFSKEEIFG